MITDPELFQVSCLETQNKSQNTPKQLWLIVCMMIWSSLSIEMSSDLLYNYIQK